MDTYGEIDIRRKCSEKESISFATRLLGFSKKKLPMSKCLLYVAVTNCSIYIHSFAGKQALGENPTKGPRFHGVKHSHCGWLPSISPNEMFEYLLICFWDKTQRRPSSSIRPPSIHSFTHHTQVAPICDSYCLLAWDQTFFLKRKQTPMWTLVREIWVKLQNYLWSNNGSHVGECSCEVVMQLRSSYLFVAKRLLWCWAGMHCSCVSSDACVDKPSRLPIA